ncbi:hypothetical protein [Nitrosospira briensis]|uniref:hypothetical protein n=1 Tax=Nitrosospira briensis TaxID=35799 RepID=UPI00046A7917|nr:hypothetical protein [Nitrosospira briensis]
MTHIDAQQEHGKYEQRADQTVYQRRLFNDDCFMEAKLLVARKLVLLGYEEIKSTDKLTLGLDPWHSDQSTEGAFRQRAVEVIDEVRGKWLPAYEEQQRRKEEFFRRFSEEMARSETPRFVEGIP